MQSLALLALGLLLGLGLAYLVVLAVGSKVRPPPTRRDLEAVDLTDRASIVAIVGASHCQCKLRDLDQGRLAESEDVTFNAALVPQPENSRDPDAVAIYGPTGRVGFLSQGDAIEYQPVVAALRRRGRTATREAYLIGGGEDAPIDVRLHLASAKGCQRSISRSYLRPEVSDAS